MSTNVDFAANPITTCQQMLILLQTQSNMSTCVNFAANPITTYQHVSSQPQTQSQHVNMCTFLLLLLYTPNHIMSTHADFCCCCPAGLAANPTMTRQHVSILPNHRISKYRFLLKGLQQIQSHFNTRISVEVKRPTYFSVGY